MRKRTVVLPARTLAFSMEKKLGMVQPTTRLMRAIMTTMGLPLIYARIFWETVIFVFILHCPPYTNWVASSMMFSWVASLPSMKPVTRPSHMTMTRSDIPISSAISEEIIMMLLPARASSSMMQ